MVAEGLVLTVDPLLILLIPYHQDHLCTPVDHHTVTHHHTPLGMTLHCKKYSEKTKMINSETLCKADLIIQNCLQV